MADSWVGGDIGGLRTMGETYTKAKGKLDGVVKPLSGKVDSLVSDAGWQGDAATSFRGAWSEDAMTAGAFAELVNAAGTILTTLASRLSTVEAGLHNAEDVAVRAGVPVGPKGEPQEMVTANPPSAADEKAIQAMNDYATVRNEALHTAQQARLEAAEQLQGLYDKSTAKASTGDKVTLYDYLRGLYAYDAQDARVGGKLARAKLGDAKQAEQDAKRAWRKERKAYEKAGKSLPKDFEAKGAYKEAMAKVEGLEQDIARADNGSTKLPYDRLLNYKVEDAAGALRLSEGVDKLPDFLKDIPVLDVAAAGACGLLEAKTDHDEGWSWTHSVTVDGAANVGGLVVGSAVAVALLPEEAGAAVVAGVGGGLIIGTTGIIDHSLHEHWREDFHDHGVLGGLAVGSRHVLSETGGDFARLGKDVWHGVKSLF
jgi:uncharacterized protein YukE